MNCHNCSNIENACNICLQPVSRKNGLQCLGACKKWAHYECLRLSPGKVQDIKAGIIKVNCPCPGCATVQPKEYLTNPPYICDNPICPANKPPHCETHDCPTKPDPLSNVLPAPGPMSQPPTGFKLDVIPSSSSSSSQPHRRLPKPPCVKTSSSESSVASSPPTAANKLVKKTKSCSCASQDSGMREKVPKTSSDTNISSTNSLYVTIQEMCKTVGQLSNQLKQLMCKMMDTNA